MRTVPWYIPYQIPRVILVLFLLIGTRNAQPSARKPNVILIVADDLGWDDVSFHGSPQIPTPALDALANNGVILNNYYVSSMDTPTRASLMTGKYAIHMGLEHDTIHNRQAMGVPLQEKFLSQYLREQGYSTHAIGKWQLGFFAREYTPTYRGFDSFFGYFTSNQDYFKHVAYDGGYGLDLRRNLEVVYNETGVYSTELFAKEADKVLNDRAQDKPFFLYLAHQAVSVGNMEDPLQAPDRFLAKFTHIKDTRRRTYAAMVAALDESVRQLVYTLKRKRLYDNTVIIFTTDNGAAAGGLDMSAGSNFPLRGVKNTLWEGGVRAVSFVHSPLIKRKGRVYNGLMHVSDWLPTIYGLAHGNAKSLGPVDGFDLWDGISNGRESPRYEVLHGIDPLLGNRASLRVGDYKIIMNQNLKFYGDWYKRPASPHELDYVRKPRLLTNASIECNNELPHPLLHTHAPLCDPMKKPCLFNIKWDPCEFHNLADFMPNTLKVMLDRLKFYRRTLKDPIYPSMDNKANPDNTGGVWIPWRDSPLMDPTQNDYIYPYSYEDQTTNSTTGMLLNKNLRKFMSDQSIVYHNETGGPGEGPVQKAQPVIIVRLSPEKTVPAPKPYVPPPPPPPAPKPYVPPPPPPPPPAPKPYVPPPPPPPAPKPYVPPPPPPPAPKPYVPPPPPPPTPKPYVPPPPPPTQPPTAPYIPPLTKATQPPPPPPTPSTTAYVPPSTTSPPAPPATAAPVTQSTVTAQNTFQETTTPKPPPSVAPPIAYTTMATVPETPPPQAVTQPTTPPIPPLTDERVTPQNVTIKVTFGEKQPQILLQPQVAQPVNQPKGPSLWDHINAFRPENSTNQISVGKVEEISSVQPPQAPVTLNSARPFKNHTHQTFNGVPEVLDIIDETGLSPKPKMDQGSGQQPSIPQIFDIIDEMHKPKPVHTNKQQHFSMKHKGPTATSKPLSISDVGSGMGIGLTDLPHGISVFGAMGDKKLKTAENQPEVSIVGQDPHAIHTFFGNISIGGRTYFVVGSESDELARVKTKVDGDRIMVHVPKVPIIQPTAKSRIDEMQDTIVMNNQPQPTISLAARNITSYPSNGQNGTKCEKVVQLDTSDNAVVVSSVVIVVIASAMVVGVAVVAMVAVVARHCQNTRNN